MADVVMVNVKLADTADFAKLNAVYTQYFPKDFPARCTAGAKLLFGLAIEVDCIAQVPD
jgi:2-iminobutanoate/2-iminopropanoate deaminase